eukprot:scaffold92116_cov29-Tisochrysis_lutea.AAC.3
MEFSQNFPFEKIRERLDDASMRVTLEELRSKRSTRLIGLVALFLYWAHLAPLAQKEVCTPCHLTGQPVAVTRPGCCDFGRF